MDSADGLSTNELKRQLERLEDDERRISVRRRKLHDLITYRRTLGNPDGTPVTDEQLAELDEQERELSQERKALHSRIDALREDLSARAQSEKRLLG